MFNDPRTRLRKLVSGAYAMVRKARKPGEAYQASIENTAPAEYTITISDKAKDVVSIDTAPTLATARKKLRGQLSALGVRLPVFEPKSVPVVPPFTEGFIDSVSAADGTIIAGTQTLITAVVVDAEDAPLAGKTVTFSVINEQSGDEVVVVQAVTDINGEATANFTATFSTATRLPPKVEASVDSSSMQTGNIFVQPDLLSVTITGDFTATPDSSDFLISGNTTTILISDQYNNAMADGVTGNPLDNIVSILGSDVGVYYNIVGPPGGEPTNPEATLPSFWYDASAPVPSKSLKQMKLLRNSGSGAATLTITPLTNADPSGNAIVIPLPFA